MVFAGIDFVRNNIRTRDNRLEAIVIFKMRDDDVLRVVRSSQFSVKVVKMLRLQIVLNNKANSICKWTGIGVLERKEVRSIYEFWPEK